MQRMVKWLPTVVLLMLLNGATGAQEVVLGPVIGPSTQPGFYLVQINVQRTPNAQVRVTRANQPLGTAQVARTAPAAWLVKSDVPLVRGDLVHFDPAAPSIAQDRDGYPVEFGPTIPAQYFQTRSAPAASPKPSLNDKYKTKENGSFTTGKVYDRTQDALDDFNHRR